MKTTNFLILLFLGITLAMSTGCATIISKSSYPVQIESNPSGATVTIRNKRGREVRKVVTPETVILKASAGFFKRAKYDLKFEKKGCLSESSFLSASMDASYWGNLFFGGLIGMLFVDPISGAMWQLDSSSVNCSLVPDTNYKTVIKPASSSADTTIVGEESPMKPLTFAEQLIQLEERKNSYTIFSYTYEEQLMEIFSKRLAEMLPLELFK